MLVSLENLAGFAHEFVQSLPQSVGTRAHIVGLQGDLGAGKTTFVQHLARELGVRESVTSPTFVIMQKYQTTHPVFTTLVHIDAYRLKPGESETIGWSGVTEDPHSLVIVEWPTLLDAFPPDAQTLVFSVTSEEERSVEYA